MSFKPALVKDSLDRIGHPVLNNLNPGEERMLALSVGQYALNLGHSTEFSNNIYTAKNI